MKLAYKSRRQLSQVLSEVTCEELHSHPSRKEWTRPLSLLLAVQCSLQMSAVTQLWVCIMVIKH